MDIIIWGATGQSIVLEELYSYTSNKIVALFDNDNSVKSPFKHIPIFYGIEGFLKWNESSKFDKLAFVVAIGGDKGKIRETISIQLEELGLMPISAIHSRSFIAKDVLIGVGVQVLPSATIAARCIIGDYSIINTNSSIDHECSLGKGVHIAPGATLAGLVEVGDYSFIGTNATVLPRVKIGRNVTIGAGSVVTKDIGNDVICFGSPAKVIRKNNS